MKSKLTKFIIVLGVGAGLYACNHDRVDMKSSVLSIQPIRNNKHIMDMSRVPFIRHPEYKKFSICHGNTCHYMTTLSLTDSEWLPVRNLFKHVKTARQEREQIRHAVALLETIIGEKTGTSADVAQNRAGNGKGQLDCVDESTNSTVYLLMMQKDSLLRWHNIENRVSRGISRFLVPHFTAVIRDKETGVQYAVDSWFLDNGQLPFIVLLSDWEQGWEP